jgi:hypothetical protein
MNDYEEARRQRVLRNREVLQDLGLLDDPLAAVNVAGDARPHKQPLQTTCSSEPPVAPAQPTRRSRRLQGETLENAGATTIGLAVDR